MTANELQKMQQFFATWTKNLQNYTLQYDKPDMGKVNQLWEYFQQAIRYVRLAAERVGEDLSAECRQFLDAIDGKTAPQTPPYNPQEPPKSGMVRYCEMGGDGPGDYRFDARQGWVKVPDKVEAK